MTRRWQWLPASPGEQVDQLRDPVRGRVELAGGGELRCSSVAGMIDCPWALKSNDEIIAEMVTIIEGVNR